MDPYHIVCGAAGGRNEFPRVGLTTDCAASKPNECKNADHIRGFCVFRRFPRRTARRSREVVGEISCRFSGAQRGDPRRSHPRGEQCPGALCQHAARNGSRLRHLARDPPVVFSRCRIALAGRRLCRVVGVDRRRERYGLYQIVTRSVFARSAHGVCRGRSFRVRRKNRHIWCAFCVQTGLKAFDFEITFSDFCLCAEDVAVAGRSTDLRKTLRKRSGAKARRQC